MIRVQKEIPEAAFPGKIAATMGIPGSPTTTTGVNALIEVFTTAGIIELKEGKYRLVSLLEEQQQASPNNSHTTTAPGFPANNERQPSGPGILSSTLKQSSLSIPICVNIELHLPASSEQAVYDALFKSIRENLLN